MKIWIKGIIAGLLFFLCIYGFLTFGRWLMDVSGGSSNSECEKLGYDIGYFEGKALKCYDGYDLFYDNDKKFLVTKWQKQDALDEGGEHE